MWNPPWTISLTLPFSFLDYNTARIVWAYIQTAIVAASSGWLWHYYGGQPATAHVVAFLALFFPPALIALGNGQITPLALGSICVFLKMEQRRYHILSGAALSITLVKPHLSYLLWAAIWMSSIYHKRWRIILGSILGTACILFWPLLWNPCIYKQYVFAMFTYPPDYYLGPNLGTLVRLLVGWNKWALQFLPTFFGIIWLALYWLPRRKRWIWENHLPLILSISVLTAAFGWLFALVLFIIPFIHTSIILLHRKSQSCLLIGTWIIMLSACALSFLLWFISPLIMIPSRLSSTQEALLMAMGSPNQFWQIVIAPLFLLGFFLGWRQNYPHSRHSQFRLPQRLPKMFLGHKPP